MVTSTPGRGRRWTAALAGLALAASTAVSASAAADRAESSVRVGETRTWPALDQAKGKDYEKKFTLRGVGRHVEVWVASGGDEVSTGLRFPDGDCRNAMAGATEIGEAQVAAMIAQFDRTVYPKETRLFGRPRPRDGRNARKPGNFRGAGARTVVLVDNIRDDNFYDVNVNAGLGGFYAPSLRAQVDRNLVTLDGIDWLHKTGAKPPHDPVPGDRCRSRPAKPREVETTLAHEWQHLLADEGDRAKEPVWFQEGMGTFASAYVGYYPTRRTVRQVGANAQLLCFQGFGPVRGAGNVNPRKCGGPQNSLTNWNDEGPGTLLADYGNVLSFMLYLRDRFGDGFLRALHRDNSRQGLASVQAQLDRFAGDTTLSDVLHDYQLTNLLDAAVAVRGVTLEGISAARVRSASLNASLNLANPAAFDRRGAPANGADYVRVSGRGLRSLSFAGGFALRPVAWQVSLVGMDAKRRRYLVRSWRGAPLNLDAAALKAFASYPQVVVVIAQDATPVLARSARYTLRVNGKARGR